MHRHFVIGSLTVAMTLIHAGFAMAGILNVDFNSGGSPTTGATDASGIGFQGFDVVTEGLSKMFTGLDSSLTTGSVTVTVTNPYSGFGRDRGPDIYGPSVHLAPMTGPFAGLYRDFAAFAYIPGGFLPALTLSGLNPNQDYQFTFQAFDSGAGASITSLQDMTPGGATNGAIANAYFFSGDEPVDPSHSITEFTSPYGASGTFKVTSNSSGILVFGIDDPVGTIDRNVTQINAFELSESLSSVPEPSSLALMGIGIFAIVLYRRRD